MNLSGGHWVWSAALRFIFMAPPLLLIVAVRGNLKELFLDMYKRPLVWVGWSTIGFGFFYSLVCFSSAYGPAWLVASAWQITIVAGSLLAPFFYTTVRTQAGILKVRSFIPVRGLLISLFILAGVALIQFQQARMASAREVLLGIIPLTLAAFFYPLGNRKMMAECGQRLDTYQRVLGMTLASMPFWLLMSAYGLIKAGVPSISQTVQSFMVAICSGVIGTILFFKATDMTGGNLHRLAAVEATQSGEIVFSLIGEVLVLQGVCPTLWSFAGMLLIMLGMAFHGYAVYGRQNSDISG